MKTLGPWGVLFLLIIILLPRNAYSQRAPSAEVTSQPKVNFFNSSRNYSRPVLNFFQRLGFRLNSDFKSRYVWNGLAYSDGPVWQPSAQIEFHGFGVSVLGNFVLNDEPNQGQFNEVDFTGYYGAKIKKLEIDFSMTYSIYPNDNPASLNFSQDGLNGNLHLAYPLGPINLFTDVGFFVFQPRGGLFWDIGIGYQKDLPFNFSLATSVLFGLSNKQYNQEFIAAGIGTGPNVFSYSLSFPVSPVKGLILTPQFNISTMLSSELRAAVPYPTNIWGELDIAYNF